MPNVPAMSAPLGDSNRKVSRTGSFSRFYGRALSAAGLLAGLLATSWFAYRSFPQADVAVDPAKEWNGHDGRPIVGFGLSKDGLRIVSADSSGVLVSWDVANGRAVKRYQTDASGLTAVAVSPDGKTAATGESNGRVSIWSLDEGKQDRTLSAHIGAVASLAFAPNGAHLASIGRDGKIRFWETESGNEAWTRTLDPAGLSALAMATDGSRLLLGDEKGRMHWLRGRDGATMFQVTAHQGAVQSAALSPDGEQAASVGADGLLKLWKLSTGENLREIELSKDSPARTVTFSAGGTRLLTAGTNGSIDVWFPPDGSKIASIRGPGGSATQVACSPNGLFAFSAGHDGLVRLWETPLPTEREKNAAKDFAERFTRRVDEWKAFADAVKQGRSLADEKRFDESLAALQLARGFVDADSIERQKADDAVASVKKVQKFADLMKRGEAAVQGGDLDAACMHFLAASSVLPDRSEAPEALREAEDAKRTQRSIADMEVKPSITLGFTRDAGSMFQHGSCFVVLLTSQPPPVGPAASSIHWDFRLQGREPLPQSDLRAKVQLFQKSTSGMMGESETLLRRGDRVHRLIGEAKPYGQGWPAGKYEFRIQMIASGKTRALGEPQSFEIGRLDWTTTELQVTADAVRRSKFRLPTGVSFRKGDALALDAVGEISPVPDAFLAAVQLAARRGAKPSVGPDGVVAAPADKNLTQHWLVANHLPFAALLYQLQAPRWIPFVVDQPPLLADSAGEILLSINSVVGDRRGNGFAAIADGDQKFWRSNSGFFAVTIRRGVFSLPEDAQAGLKYYLLQCFARSKK